MSMGKWQPALEKTVEEVETTFYDNLSRLPDRLAALQLGKGSKKEKSVENKNRYLPLNWLLFIDKIWLAFMSSSEKNNEFGLIESCYLSVGNYGTEWSATSRSIDFN